MFGYEVAVKLSLVNEVSAGLAALTRQFAATNIEAKELQKSLDSIAGMAKRGALMVGAGAVLAAPIMMGVEAARKYELAFTKFKDLNLGDAVNAEANKFARGTDLMGVSATQLMTTLSESVGILGSYADAVRLVPDIAKLNAANSAIYGGKVGEIDDGAARALNRFIDRRGGTKDEASYRRNLELAEKLVTGSGGFIKFQDLASFSQQAGTAFRGLSDQGILNYAMLLQEQGGPRAGTALMSMYQNLVAGRTPKKTMEELQAFGFGKIGQAQAGTMGGRAITTTKFSLFKPYADLMQSDPVTFFREAFLPALAKRGITNQADIIRITNDLFSNRTASGQATIMDTQLMQVMRDANLTKNAKGAQEVIKAYADDPNSKFGDLAAKYTNLMIAVGESALPLVTRLVKELSSLFKWMADHPSTVRALTYAFMGLSGALLVSGSVLMLTAGIRALWLALTFTRIIPMIGLLSGSLLRLGPALAVAAAGAAGYGLGTLLNKLGPNGDLGGYLGGKLFELIHGDANAPSLTPSGGRGQPVHVHSSIIMDGQKVGSAVTKFQVKQGSRPQTGTGNVDFSQMLYTAGGGGFAGSLP